MLQIHTNQLVPSQTRIHSFCWIGQKKERLMSASGHFRSKQKFSFSKFTKILQILANTYPKNQRYKVQTSDGKNVEIFQFIVFSGLAAKKLPHEKRNTKPSKRSTHAEAFLFPSGGPNSSDEFQFLLYHLVSSFQLVWGDTLNNFTFLLVLCGFST